MWDKAQFLDASLLKLNQQRLSADTHVFLSWETCSEGVLRNFLYNKYVAPMTFEKETHFSLIKDDKVQAKFYEVRPMCHQVFSLVMPFLFA